MSEVKHGLSGNLLKTVAMLSMLADHAGKALFPDLLILQLFGRIAFPLFAYMIAEGCRYTRNRARYFLGIFLLGAACQCVYLVAMRSLYLGVLITFSLSIAVIFALDAFLSRKSTARALLLGGVLLLTVFLALIAPALFTKQGFALDYGIYGVFFPIAVYYAKSKNDRLVFVASLLLLRGIFIGGKHWAALLALPLLFLYNGKRGKYNLKYLFYIFYPAHLAIIQLLAWWLPS